MGFPERWRSPAGTYPSFFVWLAVLIPMWLAAFAVFTLIAAVGGRGWVWVAQMATFSIGAPALVLLAHRIWFSEAWGSGMSASPPDLEAAITLHEGGEFAAAIVGFRAYLMAHPEDAQARWRLAQLFRDDLDDAMQFEVCAQELLRRHDTPPWLKERIRKNQTRRPRSSSPIEL